jgi:hypothetical protein
MDPRASMNDVDRRKFLTLPGLEFPPLGRPARGQSVYRLRYPGSRSKVEKKKKHCEISNAKCFLTYFTQ